MSQLTPFVRGFRALGSALKHQCDAATAESYKLGTSPSAKAEAEFALLLFRLSTACNAAATDLEQQIAKDLSRVGPRSDEAVNLDRVPPDSAWQPPEDKA